MFMYASSGQNKINVNEIIISRKKMTLIYIREKNFVCKQFNCSKYVTVFIKNDIHVLKLL